MLEQQRVAAERRIEYADTEAAFEADQHQRDGQHRRRQVP